MKRNADLVRAIAQATEALKPGEILTHMPDVDAHELASHVRLMVDAGLLEARVQGYMGHEPPSIAVLRLTWAGCDFLDAARSDSLWAKAKSSVIAPTASWTFDILKDWLKDQIRQSLTGG